MEIFFPTISQGPEIVPNGHPVNTGLVNTIEKIGKRKKQTIGRNGNRNSQ